MTKHKLGVILCIVFCTSLIISNIIGSKITTILFIELPASILIYPLTYIINDVFSEVYGFQKVKGVIMIGFAMNIMFAVFIQLSIWLPSSGNYQYGAEYALVLGSSIRMVIASFISYIIGSLANSFVMDVMHNKKSFNDNLLYRCMTSTFIGVALDSAIFIFVAFVGTISTGVIISMIIAQTILKTLYELILYPIINKVIAYAYALPE